MSEFWKHLLNLSNIIVHIVQERISGGRPCPYYNLDGTFDLKRLI